MIPRLQSVLPLNRLEIMTLVNFKHLDEEKLLESGKVLKQKSGYTHQFDEKLGAILREDGITPSTELEPVYGEYYRRVLEYNARLGEPVLVGEEPAEAFVRGFTLLAPWLWKQYAPVSGWEAPLFSLRNCWTEEWSPERLGREIAACRNCLRSLLIHEQLRAGRGLRGRLESLGICSPRRVTVKYPLLDRLEEALDGLEKQPQLYQAAEERIAVFVREFAPIIATLVQRFQELGVDCRNEDSPNFDYLSVYQRYVGPLTVRFGDESPTPPAKD